MLLSPPPVRLLGADTEVPCLDGRARRYVNLDYAASAPALAEVWDAVEAFMPWYSSVHRGSGVKSQLATAAFEGTRDVVAELVGARSSDSVVAARARDGRRGRARALAGGAAPKPTGGRAGPGAAGALER